MSERFPQSPLVRIYAIADQCALANCANLLLTPALRTHLAEVVADVAELDDDQLVQAVKEFDASLDGSEITADGPLQPTYERWMNNPPRAYAHSLELSDAFALQRLRHELVNRRFKAGYPTWFADTIAADYRRSEAFLQGSVLAYKISRQYFAERDDLNARLADEGVL